ncbi:unnamed protein product [Angiostrongylus costaricensis]|uniref:Iso_dh domain-containing protein n=1 Tax=Angiostrongylus costaricensis TaxID=334426 RepID=A0A0R3PKB6_ANGCS|nr:unnamed protein product [Angiostrongylus costaricensis]
MQTNALEHPGGRRGVQDQRLLPQKLHFVKSLASSASVIVSSIIKLVLRVQPIVQRMAINRPMLCNRAFDSNKPEGCCSGTVDVCSFTLRASKELFVVNGGQNYNPTSEELKWRRGWDDYCGYDCIGGDGYAAHLVDDEILKDFVVLEALQFPHQQISLFHALPLSKYGGRHTVTALPGDGIGPEMMEHIRTIFLYCHAPINFEFVQVSSQLVDGDMEGAIMAIERNGVAIKGNIETKHDDPSYKSRNVELRKRLDLYANILHCVSIPTIPTRHKVNGVNCDKSEDKQDIDIVLIRENTEGEYSGLEHETLPGIIESIKVGCLMEPLAFYLRLED